MNVDGDISYFKYLGIESGVADNHGGYFGFRANNARLENDGAMNVVVNDWKSETPKINKD